MSDWQVCIVSYKRAGRVTSDRVFRNAFVIVPKSQEEEYRKFELRNGCQVLGIEDKFDGNVSRKRNWCLNNMGDRIVIVDDDYKSIKVHEGLRTRDLSVDEVDHLLSVGFQLCEDLGTVMWGLNVQTDPQFYREFTPFSLLAPILGPFAGFVKNPLRYDERLFLKEDYDMFLQVIRKYRKVLRFNKFGYFVDHIKQSGGVVSHRTRNREVEQLQLLQRKWGSRVVKVNYQRESINPIIHVPLKGT
jgi:hypothetical protein